MSAERYIKQAIIAAMIDHPDQDKYKSRAFAGDNLQNMLDILAGKSKELTKADFFLPDDDGKFIIDSAGFWKHFDKINDLLQKNGERLNFEDFVAPLNGREDGRTLLDSASGNNGLQKLFSPDIWIGRFDEMEALWFRVAHSVRQSQFKDAQINLDIKRVMLAAEGRHLPEDALALAGLKVADITRINSLQSYQEVKYKLAAKGLTLAKEHILLTDSEGDTMFHSQGAWGVYTAIVGDLARNGQQLDIQDLLRHVGTRPNILTRAAERSSLHLVFTPEHWVNRLGDMLQLWDHVLPGWKTGAIAGKEFDLAYAAAENLTYGAYIQPERVVSAAELLVPVNAGIDGEKPVLPLSLKSTWENLAKIEKSIADNNGKGITVDDLRHVSGGLDYPVMLSAVKLGYFGKIADIARQSGQVLTVDDFLKKDNHGNSLLNILASQNELQQVFTPEIWAGRVNEMKQLWSHVRISDQGQVSFQQVEVAVKQATLKQHNKPKFKF